jgi:hypothetical protein
MLIPSTTSGGEAHILINDQQTPTNISSLNSNAGFHNTVPVEVMLEKGDGNVIRFGASGDDGMFSIS